jgi:HAD superfamily phosphoserine phosphatase-like hydrolase
VREHLEAGELVAMTTATNRFITELTAAHFGIVHLLATEPGLADGVFTGRTSGTLNMREGKVERLHEWLAQRGRKLADFRSRAYSDSINDLPLLEAMDEAVAANADERLAAIALERGWESVSLG